jgi:ABC-type polysaccharide/polyol phosphate export permease
LQFETDKKMPQSKPVIYDSAAAGWPFLEELKELLRYRGLLGLLIVNHIKTRYKRSVLGVLWTLLNPLLIMTVLAVAFSTLFRFSLENYPVYLLSGLILWNFFSQTTTTAMQSINWGGSLIKRIYLPRTVFSVAALGSELINLFLSLIPLLCIMLAMGHPFRPSLIFIPLAILLTAMFALGTGLVISTLSIFFVDAAHMYQIILTAWFYLTPVIYPVGIIPEGYLDYLKINPMFYQVELFRAPLYEGRFPDFQSLLLALAWSLVALLAGWWIFSRKADQFAYRV